MNQRCLAAFNNPLATTRYPPEECRIDTRRSLRHPFRRIPPALRHRVLAAFFLGVWPLAAALGLIGVFTGLMWRLP